MRPSCVCLGTFGWTLLGKEFRDVNAPFAIISGDFSIFAIQRPHFGNMHLRAILQFQASQKRGFVVRGGKGRRREVAKTDNVNSQKRDLCCEISLRQCGRHNKFKELGEYQPSRPKAKLDCSWGEILNTEADCTPLRPLISAISRFAASSSSPLRPAARYVCTYNIYRALADSISRAQNLDAAHGRCGDAASLGTACDSSCNLVAKW